MPSNLEIALAAGKVALSTWASLRNKNNNVLSSVGRDIKLTNDIVLQRAIVEAISQRSNLPILAEEANAFVPEKNSLTWIVDPLDGTYNCHRGIPFFSTSIALCRGLDPIIGVVVDLPHERIIVGEVGRGCRDNNLDTKVSNTQNINESILSTGFPIAAEFSEFALSRYIEMIRNFKKIRMLGSAALALAYVATGQVDAYYEQNSNVWDVAAGIALVKSAGGRVHIRTDDLNPLRVSVTADNGRINFQT